MSHRRFLTGLTLLAVLAPRPAAAAVTGVTARAAPACEAFTDERELRFRAPARTVTGHILPESVEVDPLPPVEIGMMLVLGRATLAVDGAADGAVGRIAVTFGYWQARDGCTGWEPARGQVMTFDLADDKQPDGTLRVMRAGVQAGATR